MDYVRDNPKGYWFKNKIYGWGWTPVKWQGWLVILGFVALVILNSLAVSNGSGTESEASVKIVWQTIFFALILIYVCYKKGEKPRWQWGKENSVSKKDAIKLVFVVLVSELAGIIGSVFTYPSIQTWYAYLIKPSQNPPSWIFAPVWTILFMLMGISAFIIWKKGLGRKDVKIALSIFIVQLILNTFWSVIFFGEHNPGLAFVEITVLWLAIIAMIVSFAKISKTAAWLLLPYILWVTFAGFLNYSLWQLNKNVTQDHAVLSTELWKTFTDSKQKMTFKYPGNLFLKYMDVNEWPPKVSIQDGAFSCKETPALSSLSKRTIKQVIGEQTYCIYASSEGTAGSVYTDYSYSTEMDNKTVTIKLRMRYPNCANYEDPERKDCQKERETFNLDGIVGGMVGSVVF